ncbi:histidine-type phosphatase [Luteibacter sp. 9135]|uniref:histidine-type phosphatase n=1 Tax=Luteibacter sp. 9135 TaxID=1500893 RepID=UPI00068BD76B|nr:histidine-type phosphatase [Luteibacter sp. 9135]
MRPLTYRRSVRVIAAAAALLLAGPGQAHDDLRLEQVVMVYRHGVRSPLPGEIQVDEVHGKPWPSWPVAPSILTRHGRDGVMAMARYDRERLAVAGLVPATGCPAAARIRLWANTDQRTIASAQAFADGFAPGCALVVDHLPEGQVDPIFNPVAADAVDWDGKLAVDAIQRETHGPDALTATHRGAMEVFSRVMGCKEGDTQDVCHPATWKGSLSLAKDGRGIALDGPIAKTSGTAEAIIMAYLEGMPLADVGWGRVDAAGFLALSQLHALLFAVHARPSYVADRVASVLAGHVVTLLQQPDAPRLSLFVGSDNNILALAGVLGVHVQMPGYAEDDPPVGGALELAVWRSATTRHRYVTVTYQAQTPTQLRESVALSLARPPARQPLLPAACPAAPTPCDADVVLDTLRKAAALQRTRRS